MDNKVYMRFNALKSEQGLVSGKKINEKGKKTNNQIVQKNNSKT